MSTTFGITQEDSHKEKTSTSRKRGQPSTTTIKVPILSQIKVRIIYPSLALLSCENSSNLCHLWESSFEIAACRPYKRYPNKGLYGTYTLDGDHQQRLGRRATTYCLGETGPNPYSGSEALEEQLQ